MKKLTRLRLLLSVGMICSGIISMFGVTVTKDNINYNVNTTSNTASVTGPTSKDIVIENLVIPAGVEYNGTQYPVTSISSSAFYGCSGFTGSLTIPNSVQTIGNFAFQNCSGFTGSLTIPNSVQSIGDYAFNRCSGFTGSLTLGNSVQTIGNSAFNGCSGFNGELTIPDGVTSIGSDAFYQCSGFTGSLTISESVTSIGESAFNGCSGFTGSLTIPESVTSIGNYIFNKCSGFTGSLTIPDGVTSIGRSAFNGCSGFTGSLTIGNSVQTIGNLAFFGCSGFEGSLTIPESVTSIGSYAFYNCSGFTSLSLPESVASIGEHAFNRCSGFKGSLTIPESVTSIEGFAFDGCSGFTGSLTIPNSVQTIGNSAFNGCSGFTGSLTIPEGVTSIENSAFSSCSGFKGSLTIPASVTSIGKSAFYYCPGFNEFMYSLNPTPPACQSLPSQIKIVYVPFGSKEAYQEADFWKDYTIMVIPGELDGNLQVEDFAIDAAETKDVEVNFVGEMNANTYSGFQFDITLPEGISISEVALNDDLTIAGFKINNTPTADKNKIRVVAFNPTGKSSEITDAIVTLTVTAAANAPHGQSQITISKASFSTILGEDLTMSDSQTTVTINNIPVNGFTITPDEDHNIYVGQECNLLATVIPENATNKNFTWTVDNLDDGYVSVVKNENGEITVKGVKLGKAVLKLTALDYQGYTMTVDVNVVPTPAQSVEISEADLILLEGTTWELTATVYPEDTTDKTITWTSESDDTATVTQDGLVTAVKAGQTTIKATCGTAEGTCTVIVKAIDDITVTPGDGSTEGDEDQNPGENTEDGMAIVGSDLILRVGQEGTVTLAITPSVNYDPALVWSLGTGGDSYVQITRDEQSSLTATFKGLAVGKTTYSVSTPANNEEILSGNITVIAENPVMSLSLAPESISLPKNALPYQLTATITPQGVTTPTLSWSSSLESIATVDTEGKVSPVAQGDCYITVTTTDGTDLSAVCHVIITEPIDDEFEFDFDDEVMGDAEGISIYLGATYKFVPKAKEGYVLPDNITWSSSDSQTVSVEDDGTIHGLQLGDATITATATVNNQEVTATCDVKVIPIPAKSLTISGGGVKSIKRKETLTLTATVLPENTTYSEVTWETSSAQTATVSQEGVVTGVNKGIVTITAYVTQYPDVRDTYELEITDILLGDSNDNGIVTVADVVTTANHLIDMPVVGWSFVNADVTQDNTISMADVTGTVQIILDDLDSESTLSRMRRLYAPIMNSDRLISDNFESGQTETRIDVRLENSIPYAAMQATIILPEGMKVNEVVEGARLSDHMLLVNNSQEGMLKVVIFSFYNTAFEETDEPLFTLVADTEKAYGNIRMVDIFGSDAQTNEYELGYSGGLNDNLLTGVESLPGEDVVILRVADGIEVYNAQGYLINVYSISGTTVASRLSAAEVEKFELNGGIYLVTVGSKTVKIAL